jgi:hypothetical protein
MDKRFYELLEKYVPKFATEQKLILPKLKKIELPKLKPINPPSPITSSSSEATNSVTSSVL